MVPPQPFPEPLEVPPLLDHKQTFILLHGRGANAWRFGPTLLDTPFSLTPSSPETMNTGEAGPVEPTTLRTAFPHAKFVFPTAPPMRATIYNRVFINQWFDSWHLTEPMAREELQIGGLQEAVPFIHGLIRREVALLGGAEHLVLGGLSQGCAASLVSALLWEGPRLGATFGMCGWLPYRRRMEDAMATPEAADWGDGLDLFEVAEDAHAHGATDGDPRVKATGWLREELDLHATLGGGSSPLDGLSVFLGHGQKDEKVPVQLGLEAAECLRALGARVSWREYEGLGHWYSADMLSDLVRYLLSSTALNT